MTMHRSDTDVQKDIPSLRDSLGEGLNALLPF